MKRVVASRKTEEGGRRGEFITGTGVRGGEDAVCALGIAVQA